MKTPLKLTIVIAVTISVAVAAWLFVFRSEETGAVYVEVVSDNGVLKLTMMLDKTMFTTNPREPVRINLTLVNIGDQDITLTFHYNTKFDFMVWAYTQGWYGYRWSYDHIQGPVGWSANASAYPVNITLEPPEMSTFVLRPGEKISQTLTWDQLYDGSGGEAFSGSQTQLAPKGKYRVEGFAGFARWHDPWSPENPLRFFEYVSANGTLVSTVLKTPGIDISLV